MSEYQAYRNRIGVSGGTLKNTLQDSTKRQQVIYFMNSPSLSDVVLNQESETRPCIVSNEKTFLKRRFLFLPDTHVQNGMYIKYQDLTYLITDNTMDDIYPQAFGELCNETFKILTGSEKVEIDRDAFNRPIYDDVNTYDIIPCTWTTKAYSVAENAPIPLPDGVIDVKVPYNPEYKIATNYETEYRGEKYRVTSTSYEGVINDVGFIEIRLQRVVSDK